MLPVYSFTSDLVDPAYRTHVPDDPAPPCLASYPYLDAYPIALHHDAHDGPVSPQLVYPPARCTDPAGTFDYYAPPSQPLFPTPSELLSNISQRRQTCQRDVPESRPCIAPSPPPPQTGRQPSPDATAGGGGGPASHAANKTESQRKARQRAIAEEIGFTPTDPDTISSHEKKRHYLECLEQYVLYLHEQLRLVQTAPLALERVSTYRGLSSRSIRTLLVHMQNTNKTLHEGTLVEEQVFLDLSGEVMAVHSTGLPVRRHSVDVAGMSTPGFDPASSHSSDDVTASASPCSSSASTDPAAHRFLFPDGM